MKNLRVVFVSLSWNNQLPFRIAIAKGFFKAQGLTVEQIFVRGGPTAIAALGLGNVDFASIGGAQAADPRQRTRSRPAHHRLAIQLHQLHSPRQQRSQERRRSARQGDRRHRRGRLTRISPSGYYLKRHNLDPDKDVTLRAIGGTALRAIALERGLIAAAPFSGRGHRSVCSTRVIPMIVNLNEALRIPQSIFVTRGEMLQKSPTPQTISQSDDSGHAGRHVTTSKKRSRPASPADSKASPTSSTVLTICSAPAMPPISP